MNYRKTGSRFHVSHDFGYVTLDILKVITEDSGVYTCKAINKSGEAVSSISLKVKARSAIDADSLQPDAWQKIQLKEAEMNKVPEMFVDTTPQQAPVFTKHTGELRQARRGPARVPGGSGGAKSGSKPPRGVVQERSGTSDRNQAA